MKVADLQVVTLVEGLSKNFTDYSYFYHSCFLYGLIN